MSSAILNKTIIDIESANTSDIKNHVVLRANGSRVAFDGFLKIYNEGVDEKNENEIEDNLLPKVSIGEKLDVIKNISIISDSKIIKYSIIIHTFQFF